MRRDDWDWNHEAATEAWERAHAPEPDERVPEFAEDSAPHVCDEQCCEWCESFSAAIKKYTRGAA